MNRGHDTIGDLWPDPDRRENGLYKALIDVHQQQDPYDKQPDLQPDERRCLQAAAAGLQTKEIAAVFGMSYLTVQDQLKAARRRLRAKNTTHACCEALRHGLIL
jgi:DNA-binding CsgD family transcriptional regulator